MSLAPQQLDITGCSILVQQMMFTGSLMSVTNEGIKTFAKSMYLKNSNLQKNSINLPEGDLIKLFWYCIESNKGKKATSP